LSKDKKRSSGSSSYIQLSSHELNVSLGSI